MRGKKAKAARGPLRRYRVRGMITVSVSTVVEAASGAEAKELAGERGVMSLCHQCAVGEETEEWVTSGELDGEPKGLKAEEE